MYAPHMMKHRLALLSAFLLAPLVISTTEAASAPVQPSTWIKADADRPDAIYKVGEKAVLVGDGFGFYASYSLVH